MTDKIFRSAHLINEAPGSHVDPDQLQKELDRAFGAVTKRLEELEHFASTQKELQFMVLTTLIESGIADRALVVQAINNIAETVPHDSKACAILIDTADKLREKPAEITTPHLSLVPDEEK